MKHFTLLIVALTMFAWQGNSQTLNQNAAWPNAAWTLTGTYDVTMLLADPTASANFSYDDDGAGSGSTDILVATSPVIDLTAASGAGETWLNVDYDHNNNLSYTFDLEWYDADGATWTVWEAIVDNSALTGAWCAALPGAGTTSSTLDISAFTATQLSGFQYRINYDATSGWGYGFCMSAPTIVSSAPPACLDPTALTATAITSSGADLGWMDNAGAGLFNVEYDVAGFTLGTGTQIMGTTNNPESITGLNAATAYEFYVQVDCGGGNLSAWVGPFSFSTTFNAPTGVTCGAGFATFVFSDDMEANNGWTGNIGTAAGTWDFATGSPGGNSSSTGPSGPASGTTYTEYEASGSQALASMVSPMIDLSSGSSEAELSFYMHAYGTEIGTLNVGVSNSPAGPFTNEFSWTGQYQTSAAQAWEQIGVDLTAYLGQQIYIEFSYAPTGPSFYGDMAIDLVQVETCVTCPAPTNFNLTASDLTSGDFDWTENGSALEWMLEYGTPGFTPGTGTDFPSVAYPQNVGGLTSNSFYDIYLQSVCGPGDTSALVGPITFNTYDQGLYMDWSNECPTAGFVDISSTGLDLGLTDDSEVSIDPLPFPVLYQGLLMNNMTVGNNGGLQLGTTGANIAYGGNFTTLADGYMFPWGDDLDSETGNVYAEVIGTPGSQTFIIQWDNICNFSGSIGAPTVNFQLQIDEATGEIFYVYEDVEFGGTYVNDDFAGNADIGLSGPNQDITVSTNDQAYLMDNSCVRFYYTNCPSPLNYTVTYTTVDEAGITWNAGLAGETDWTIIYGPAGFDPLASGTTVTTSTPALIIPGLDDITEYDVYIYADCNPGVLQSLGATGSFTTLPNCADVTGLAATTASDSIFTSWMFTENAGFPSTGFDIEYGNAGYTQGMGSITNADNNYTDTTMDASLLSGALYDVYVQTICGTDSSNFVGPFTVTMPLDNDSTCLSETLVVDGTLYTFDKTGATAQLNEVNITPPVTGYNTNDGWGQTGLNYSTWFTFEAPASGQVRIDGTDENFAGQMAVYDVTDCADFATFTLLGANDNAIIGGGSAPNFTVCGLTPGNTYYLMHDANSTTSTTSNGSIYSVALTEVVVEGGTTNGIVDICVGDTVDLFTAIAGYDMGGTWYQETPTLGLNGSEFVSAGLAYQVFNFQYEVVDGCAMDSVVQQVEIYGPSSAGTDGTITACQNEPVDLLMGLGGNVDLGGTWYDPTNTATPSAIVTSSIPGSFNYDYITGNGVCADDTANVIVSVDASCDYLSIEEVAFENMSIFPNPTNGSVFLTNEGSNEVFNFELTDVNGKVIVAQDAAINGTETTEVSLTNLESGFYLIRVFNDNADKTFRIIKE